MVINPALSVIETFAVLEVTVMDTVSSGSTSVSPTMVIGIDANVAFAGTLMVPLVAPVKSVPAVAVPPVTDQLSATTDADAGLSEIGTLTTCVPLSPSVTVGRSPTTTSVLGTLAGSSSMMVIVAAELPIAPAPDTDVRASFTVSGDSGDVSPTMLSGTVAEISPAANVTVPLVAV